MTPLTEKERARLILELNRTAWTPPKAASVGEQFQSIAARFTASTALRSGTRTLTYAELLARAATLADTLRRSGVHRGDIVAIPAERSIEAIVGIVGIVLAGAAYLPVDRRYPRDRIHFLLADAGARTVVNAPGVEPLDVPSGTTVIQIAAAAQSQMPAEVVTPVSTNDLIYVMYTSGSTGKPKGVRIPHRGVMRLVLDAKYARLDARTVMLHAAPLGFDASTLEIWGPLLNGGCCVIHDEDIPTGPGLAATLQASGTTTAWLTSALFNAVVDDDPAHLRGLQELLIGGEALSVAHVRRALEALPGLSLVNGYGPTECTTFAATHRIDIHRDTRGRSIPIGRPITETQLYILDERRELLRFGETGELYIGGMGVGLGYLNRPELTAERFIANPFDDGKTLLYRTGDLVRYREDGAIEFLGRADTQVKIRGYRIELGEIEAALAEHPGVKSCAVNPIDDPHGGLQLAAYVVPVGSVLSEAEVTAFLASRLPAFMVPSFVTSLDALPVTANGKLDRRALPLPSRAPLQPASRPVGDSPAETEVMRIFCSVLGIAEMARTENFFDRGGNSLLAVRAIAEIRKAGLGALSIAAMYRDPTVQGISAQLAETTSASTKPRVQRPSAQPARENEPIAIIGMAGRFPGAQDVEDFWQVLCDGRDTITRFDATDLDPSIPRELVADPGYVRARGVLKGVEDFDAGFFGVSPREAELTDPQHRLFMETCWECLERSGHVPEKYDAPIGVFAGMYNATYFQRHVAAHPDKVAALGEFQVMLANEKDYIATRVAHKLNLTGPAVSVHTACSTSLVAIAQAVAALRAGQCGMALAGGSSITCPPSSGYLYQEGAMLSPDGVTRSFDASAQGTVFSDGVAVVMLKPLSRAIADGNTIHALIRGVAVNNDGAKKASFTAPGVDGQASVVEMALQAAGVSADSISYVEAHGTATPLGDPVEVAALTQAYRRYTARNAFCKIGSLKSNMGHLVIAAGATGVIKTALALEKQWLPASIHYQAPNPQLQLESTPFVVADKPESWPRGSVPRRAGVSSFGVGGTNAHVILEEAPAPPATHPSSGLQLIRLSARATNALEGAATRLAQRLKTDSSLDLADVAFTLEHGRRDFPFRATLVAASLEAAINQLGDPATLIRRSRKVLAAPRVAMLFPGQGAQYPGMGSALYEANADFRTAIDECAAALQSDPGIDIRTEMFRGDGDSLGQTRITQPATFCIEYALARMWLAAGIRPDTMIGHSIGEFVAAALAGIMPVADAIRLVALRGALMQRLPAGSMLSVRSGLQAVQAILRPGLQVAAENSPLACVVAGETAAIDAFASDLEARGIVSRKLQTSHAFHSAMMEPAVAPFAAAASKVALKAPTMRIISTATGEELKAEEACDPQYWAQHMRRTVRFSSAVRAAAGEGRVFLEVGPRGTLTTLARQHTGAQGSLVAIATLSASVDTELETALGAYGDLWSLGFSLAPLPGARTGRRVVLPTYPFERHRYWLEARPAITGPAGASAPAPSINQSTINLDVSMATPSVDRKERLAAQLRTVLEDVSGIEIGPEQNSASFVEQGLDSLTLTQVALQLKKTFGLNITFRNLMETYRSVNDLVAHLDSKLPADAPVAAVAPVAATFAGASPPVAAAPFASVPVPAVMSGLASGGSQLQQLIQQQMLLMAQQLALLGGSAMPVASHVPAAAPGLEPARTTPSATAVPESVETAGEEDKPEAMKSYDVKKAFGAIARIHTTGTELTERQKTRLAQFMARYIEKTKKSKDYTIEHRPHLADPRVVNGFRPQLKEIIYQIVIERSKGSRMWDLDGNEYVDALNGFGMSFFGWQPDFVVDAVRKQLETGYDIGPQHPLAGEVARLFCEVTGNDRAALCNTGSEAVMGCVRVARTVTGRSKIAIFTGSYHGIFDEVIVRGTKKLRSVPAAPGIMPNTSENVLVLDYGTPETLQILRDNAQDLAAILVEPVQSRRPDFQPREFLQQLRELTAQSGTLLIFDEVVTGFRSHPGGIQALFGIRADLCSYGKVVGGGFPIGVISGKREFMDALDGGHWNYGDDSIPTVGVTYFAGTFVRHPLALVAAKAVLEHVKRSGPELQERVTRATHDMVEDINAFCRTVGAPIVLKSFSSVWKVFFTEDHPLQDLLFAMMRNRGVHILDNFPCFFTTAHSAADIQIIKDAFKDAVREMQQSDFLPSRQVAEDNVVDLAKPPVPGAKLGKDDKGKPAWFIPKPGEPGKFLKVGPQ
jgi:amino acid adenylation domain-containing protein